MRVGLHRSTGDGFGRTCSPRVRLQIGARTHSDLLNVPVSSRAPSEERELLETRSSAVVSRLMRSGEHSGAAAKLGEPQVMWYALMLLALIVFGGGLGSLVWPGFQERWFDTPSGTTFEWVLWMGLTLVALAFTVYFVRRLWMQLTLRASNEGICQSSFPGRRRCLRWQEVTRVERPGHGNQVMLESPRGTVRITQDAYKDPDQLYGFLAGAIPEDIEGWERLNRPTS